METQRKKVVVVGDSSCGKTGLVCRFGCGDFPLSSAATVLGHYSAEIKVNRQLVELSLVDTAGLPEFNAVRPRVYPDTDVVIICFSVDNPVSLENIQEKWSPETRHCCKYAPVILVGNKTDLRCAETKKTVPFKEGQRMAHHINAAAYMECSAKNNEGVREIFERAALISLEKLIKPKSKEKKKKPRSKCVMF